MFWKRVRSIASLTPEDSGSLAEIKKTLSSAGNMSNEYTPYTLDEPDSREQGFIFSDRSEPNNGEDLAEPGSKDGQGSSSKRRFNQKWVRTKDGKLKAVDTKVWYED